jgi:hypothetical protein
VSPFDFTGTWPQRLASEVQQWEETLVREDAQELLARVGLTPKLAVVKAHNGSVRLKWGCLHPHRLN